MKSDEVQQKLHALRDNYTSSLAEKVSEIERLWQTLSEEQWNTDDIVTLHRHVHGLAGSGSTFGFDDISKSARSLCDLLKTLTEQTRPPDADVAKIISFKMIPLTEACRSAAGVGSTESTDDIARLFSTPQASQESASQMVLIIEEQAGNSVSMASQIEQYGYTTKTLELKQLHLPKIQHTVRTEKPQTIIIDLSVFSLPNINLINAINKLFASGIPILFVSDNNSIDARLQAVRNGSDGYFTKPVEVLPLIDKIDSYNRGKESGPYRVMIIEDQPELAEAYATFLQQAEMETITINDPLLTSSHLDEFNPDLILLDMYMPGCTGLELASIIRQQSAYASVPIVFLSGENDIYKQLNAMSVGGDDFLTKPIQPGHLVSAVRIRSSRYRDLRSHMVRDSLTGLFNHSKTAEQLLIEMARADRNNEPLAYAMIDIDNFKSVNDTYGHAAGDQVIKSLSRLLKQSLRKTDVVGRYGGEEFAAILYGAELDMAREVMDKIRLKFEQSPQVFGDKEVTITFSCGIAGYPAIKSSTDLHKAADDALYQAKTAGRNCTLLADHKTGTKH